MATHAFAMAEAPQPPGRDSPSKSKNAPLARRRLTIAARSGTRGSIQNPDEVHEAVKRARAIKHSDCPVAHGKSIADTLLEITSDVSERLKEHYVQPWEKDGAEDEAKALIQAADGDNGQELEAAALKIQSHLRRRTAVKEAKIRKARKSLHGKSVRAVKEIKSYTNKDIAEREKQNAAKQAARNGEWHPEEVKSAIQELLDHLHTEAVQASLELTAEGIQARVQEEDKTESYCTWLEEQAKNVLEASDQIRTETLQKCENLDKSGSAKIKQVWDSAESMIDLGKKAQAERNRLQLQLQNDKRLHLGEEARQKLEDKKQLVAHLGNRLVEIRSNEESEAKLVGGLKEHTNNKIEELKTEIQEKQDCVKTLTNYFDTVEKFVRTLEITLEYLDHEHHGQLPEEGVLETIEEVKSIVRETKIEPLLRQQDEEHTELFQPPDMSEVVALEDEIARLQGLLSDLEERAAALSKPSDHDDRVDIMLSMICGPFNTASGKLEPNSLQEVTPEESHALQEALLAQIQITHEHLKPGLRKLSQFETLLQNAQDTLELFASQRKVFINHVRTLKDNLVRDSESLAVGTGSNNSNLSTQLSRVHDKEERLRQTMQAFHDGEDSICGGVEEVNARLDYTRELVSDQLKIAERLRYHCDKNRWEIQDILGAPMESFKPTELPNPKLTSFTQDSETLIDGAARVRRQRWEQELAQRQETGKQAATAARELLATKAAIAAEVEARAAMDWLEPGNADDGLSDYGDLEDSGDEKDDEEPTKQGRGTVKFDAEAVSEAEAAEGKETAEPGESSRGSYKKRDTLAASQVLGRRNSPRNSVPSRRNSKDREGVQPNSLVGRNGSVINLPGSVASPPAPELPPAVSNATDIMAMHHVNLKLASSVEEAAFACRSLATRLGGNPLEPSRCHVLVGDAEEKEKIKSRMEEMVADQRRWWASRQLVTLDPEPYEPLEAKKEADAHEAALSRLQRAFEGDMAWVEEDAVVKLQAAQRGLALRKKVKKNILQKEKEESAVTLIQRLARGHAARVQTTALKKTTKAAVKIQSIARGNLARKKAEKAEKAENKGERVVSALRSSMRSSKTFERRSALDKGSTGEGGASPHVGFVAAADMIPAESGLGRETKSKSLSAMIASESFAGLSDAVNKRNSAPDPAASGKKAAAAKKIQAGFRRRMSLMMAEKALEEGTSKRGLLELEVPFGSESPTGGDSPRSSFRAQKRPSNLPRNPHASARKSSPPSGEDSPSSPRSRVASLNLDESQQAEVSGIGPRQQKFSRSSQKARSTLNEKRRTTIATAEGEENQEEGQAESERPLDAAFGLGLQAAAVRAAKTIQAGFQRYKRRVSKSMRGSADEQLQDGKQPATTPAGILTGHAAVAAAKKIQAGYRKAQSKKAIIQQMQPRKQTVETVESPETLAAAKKIQAAARRRMSQKIVAPDAAIQNAKALDHANRDKHSDETSARKSSVERLSIPAKGEDAPKKTRSKSKRSTTFSKGGANDISKASKKDSKQRSSTKSSPAAASGSINASASSTAGRASASSEQAPPEAPAGNAESSEQAPPEAPAGNAEPEVGQPAVDMNELQGEAGQEIQQPPADLESDGNEEGGAGEAQVKEGDGS